MKKLCFNCLKFGHRVFACRSPKMCDQRGKKHHSLLHQEKTVAKTSEEKVRQVGLVATTVKPHGTPSALLITSVAEVKSVRRARARIFFDPGAQVSFVSSSLVNVVQAPKAGTAKLSFRGFGSSAVSSVTSVSSVTVSLL